MTTAVFYVLTFISIYVQVFLLVTFLHDRKNIITRKGKTNISINPSTTVIVPCWNEERTIERTVESLLEMDYPKDKLKVFLIDDGSTDNTWGIMKKYKNNSQIEIFKKENGGKHTAMNMGIERANTEFVSCLDADSFVEPQALKRIMSYFIKDSSVMAVAPSILIYKPKNILQTIQRIEYNWAVYIKKMLALVGGIHVTPGPFSVYRKEVFEKIGVFKKAHNTEDMEIAYRMQKNHMKIEQCNDAFVYTVAPNSVLKLYRQRLRWIYGFIKNSIDYRSVIFKRKYGAFGLFTVPSGVISIIAVPYLLGALIFQIVNSLSLKVAQANTVGVGSIIPKSFNFDLFFINTEATIFMTIVLFGLIFLSMIIGHKMAEGTIGFAPFMILFSVIYAVIAPFWVMKAIINTIAGKRVSWR